MIVEVKGVVTRTAAYAESDLLLTVFTEECGLISAFAKGGRSLKSRYLAPMQLFCYSLFLLYKKGEQYWVRDVDPIEGFFAIQSSIEKTALAAYLCDVVNQTATAQPDKPFLRLVLNSLYALSEDKIDPHLLKAAFEIRAAALLGFMPDLSACRECGGTAGEFILDVMDGCLVCRACRARAPSDPALQDPSKGYHISLLTDAARAAMEYAIRCPLERLFSFRITGEDAVLFGKAAENYLINHLERSFKSLAFFHEVNPL
ncbi:MAG: DNA repair protein RecO [Eubacteriales bacterium]